MLIHCYFNAAMHTLSINMIRLDNSSYQRETKQIREKPVKTSQDDLFETRFILLLLRLSVLGVAGNGCSPIFGIYK